MRRRLLSQEDEALWRLVVRDVAPLRPRRRRPEAQPAVADPAPVPQEVPKALAVSAPAPGPAARPKMPAPPPLAPIDRHERRAVQRGTRALEGRIDLHGMRQDEAQAALVSFLQRSQNQGRRLVLVITGKGRAEMGSAEMRSDPGLAERGVLRRVVPHWLGSPALRALVVGFEQAGAGHGGSGALYVRLRRSRTAEF